MGPRRKVMFPFFGDGIFTQEGAAWKHSRELLRPQFVHKQYEGLEVFRETVDNLIELSPRSMPYKSGRLCIAYTQYATVVPFGTRTGDCSSGPPPTGREVVSTAVRELTGTDG